MDERLLEIVGSDAFWSNRIHVLMLEECTNRYPLHNMDGIKWENVRHLHILQTNSREHNWDIDVGFYASEDHAWVLCLGEFDGYEQVFIERCIKNLELLNISSADVVRVDLSGGSNLHELRIHTRHYGQYGSYVCGVECHNSLKRLFLRNVDFNDNLSLYRMTKLKDLIIDSRSRLHSKIYGINSLVGLDNLMLSNIFWEDDIDLSQHPDMERLALWDGLVKSNCGSRYHGLTQLNELRSLRLQGNQAAMLDTLPSSAPLRSLRLIQSQGLTEIEGLERLPNLEILDVSGTGIKRLPEGLRSMKKLKKLILKYLSLEELPYWLPELNLPITTATYGEGILLAHTTVMGVERTTFEQSQDMIRKWFEELKNKNMVPLREGKVVFLGDGEAGKTHTIARLLNNGGVPQEEHFDDKATPGIVIKDKHYVLDGNDVNVHYWDFGGQDILHSMHRMFLTEQTLYVVLINARDDTQDDRARYWLHNIRSFADGAPVLLVLNKIDQNPNASVNEPELRALYGGLRQVVKLSALKSSPEEFNNTLTAALLDEIRGLGTIGTLWPIPWAELKQKLQTMQHNFITGVDYKEMCRTGGVNENWEREELLHRFNDLGVSFFYKGNRKLENYVILRPKWITNGIYILLYNKSEKTKNGVIPKDVIHEMLGSQEEGRYRRVLKGVTYDVYETEYVLEVMRKFGLSYEISNEAEFIPALCQRESLKIAEEYAEDPNALEFRMTYDYLPDNVIHRLMVEMRQDLDLNNVWRTGARFCQQGTRLSAVVKIEGDVLRIFVRSEDPLHSPNTYLCILKENIDRINVDMKLKLPYAEVIYKTDQGAESFDYEDLLNALQDGEETYRSKKQRRRIPICDILNQSGRNVELALNKLRSNILSICLQLQGNRACWNYTEDQRNTYMRDALRTCKYQVYDQSSHGEGGGRKSYGELDLEIRQETNIPWTIIEALIITDKSKTNWNQHLKKLLDNYNPSGLRHLFLLTYVDCSRDVFEELMNNYSEHVRQYDPIPYERMSNSFTHIPTEMHGEPAYLRVMRCTYDRGGIPTTVTHIFARMGE